MVFSLLYMVLRGVLRWAPAGDQRDRELENRDVPTGPAGLQSTDGHEAAGAAGAYCLAANASARES